MTYRVSLDLYLLVFPLLAFLFLLILLLQLAGSFSSTTLFSKHVEEAPTAIEEETLVLDLELSMAQDTKRSFASSGQRGVPRGRIPISASREDFAARVKRVYEAAQCQWFRLARGRELVGEWVIARGGAAGKSMRGKYKNNDGMRRDIGEREGKG